MKQNEGVSDLKRPKNTALLDSQLQVTPIENLCQLINDRDFMFLPSVKTKQLLNTVDEGSLNDWETFKNSWPDLVVDQYMADGGTYRTRRYATLSAESASHFYRIEPHQPHYQSLNYNTLNGGIARHYEPIESKILNGKVMSSLLTLGLNIFSKLSPYSKWHIEIHQFRIDAQSQQAAKPTPEGAHRDGVNYVMMVMVDRMNVINGATNIYDAEQRHITEFILNQPLDLAIVNDERIFHGVTPIVQLDTNKPATRDVLVITFRKKSTRQ